MDFNFSDDQIQLQDAVRRYVEKAYSFDRRRAIEAAGGFDAKAYAELAELGLTGLAIDGEYDGMDMGPVEALLVMQELGRGIVLEPLNMALLCAPVLRAHASAALCKQWLPGIASGQVLMSLALGERQSRYSLSRIACQATAVGEAYLLSGRKTNVAAGAHAQAFLASAMLNGEPALFVVDAKSPGIATHGYTQQSGAAAGDVEMTNTPAQLVCANASAAIQLAHDLGAALACGYAVGAMDKSLAITTEYMNTRKQFGATLASFQALRHKAADVKMQLELGRSMAYYAFLKLGAPAAERTQAVARAKLQLGNSMRFVSQQCVQLHGGIGVTDEYIMSHYFRALTALELQFGDTLHHLGEVSARMNDTAGVFA